MEIITKEFIKWEDLNTSWENIDMKWEDIAIEIIKRINQGGGFEEYFKGNPWKKKLTEEIGKEKTDKFIKIMCKINGLDYEQIVKPNNDIKINVDHFQKTFESMNIKIEIKK